MDGHEDVLRMMDNHLDLVADAMRDPPVDEDQVAMVSDMLRECQDQRVKLEEAAMVVIGQDGGEAAFNEITGMLDRLEQFQDRYRTWSAAASSPDMGVSGVQSSPVMSSQSSVNMNDSKKDKKRGKERKEKKQRGEPGSADDEFAFSAHGQAAVPAAAGTPGDGFGSFQTGGFGGWPDSQDAEIGGGVPASCGGFEEAGWPQHAQTPGEFGGNGGSWGDTPTVAKPAQATTFGMEELAGSFQGAFGNANVPRESSRQSFGMGGAGVSQFGTLHIKIPFAEVEYDQDSFKKQFARATAQATGIPQHRIRVLQVRPGV